MDDITRVCRKCGQEKPHRILSLPPQGNTTDVLFGQSRLHQRYPRHVRGACFRLFPCSVPRALSRVCCRCRHHTRKPGIPLQVQPLKQAAMAHLITLLAFIAPIAVVFGWVLSNQHRAKEIGKLLTSIFESHE